MPLNVLTGKNHKSFILILEVHLSTISQNYQSSICMEGNSIKSNVKASRGSLKSPHPLWFTSGDMNKRRQHLREGNLAGVHRNAPQYLYESIISFLRLLTTARRAKQMAGAAHARARALARSAGPVVVARPPPRTEPASPRRPTRSWRRHRDVAHAGKSPADRATNTTRATTPLQRRRSILTSEGVVTPRGYSLITVQLSTNNFI